MEKNPVLGAVLGFFVLGLFYSKGLNLKTLWIVIGLVALSYAIMLFISSDLMCIANVIGGFMGYKSAKDHNESIAGTGTAD